jgi:hypothetical protein
MMFRASSACVQDEYTLVRAEPRKLTDDELASIQVEIRRHRRSGTVLLLVGAALIVTLVGAMAVLGEQGRCLTLALDTIGLLMMFTVHSGLHLILWTGTLRTDSQRGQVSRFILPGASEAEGMTLEILEKSGRVWRWEGGPPVPEFPTLGLSGPGFIRRATEVGVRHLRRTEFAATGWRELPWRLVVWWAMLAWILLIFGSDLFGAAFGAQLGFFATIPKWLLIVVLVWVGDLTRRFSLVGWWRWLAFQRDRAEGIALCFRGEFGSPGSNYPPRATWHEVLLYSGKRLGWSVGDPAPPVPDRPSESVRSVWGDTEPTR